MTAKKLVSHRLDPVKEIADREPGIYPVTLPADLEPDGGSGAQLAAVERAFAQGVLDRNHSGAGSGVQVDLHALSSFAFVGDFTYYRGDVEKFQIDMVHALCFYRFCRLRYFRSFSSDFFPG